MSGRSMGSKNETKVGDSERRFYCINVKLLPLKLHFFTLAAGIASFLPYLPLHAKQIGLSATAVGILYATVSAVSLVAKPFFGWVADKYRRLKLLAICMLLTSIIFYLVIAFIPSIERGNIQLKIDCSYHHPQITYLNGQCSLGSNRTASCQQLCTNCSNDDKRDESCGGKDKGDQNNVSLFLITDNFRTTFALVNDSNTCCHKNFNLNCILTCPYDEWCFAVENEYKTRSFWMMFVCFIFVGIGERVLRSLSDSICYDMLENKGKNYGRQRLWHSFGFCVAPFLTGYLIDVTRQKELHNYAIAVYTLVTFMALDIFVVMSLDLSAANRKKKSDTIFKDVSKLAIKASNIIAAITLCVGGMLYGFDAVYYFIFMAEIGASRTLVGISVSCCLITQIPFMFFAGDIIKKIGHFNSFALSLILIAIRFQILVQIYDPYWVLAPQIFLKAAIDFFTICLTSYAKAVAPPGTESTLQQICGSLYGGIGIGLGYAGGGLIFDYYGSRVSFTIASIIAAGTALFNFIFSRYSRCKEKRKQLQIYECVAVSICEKQQEG